MMHGKLGSDLEALGIRRSDIQEQFIRSSGPGGQNVNKTSTCVQLRHLPTGIEVKCQMHRTQAANRIAALRLLVDKIDRYYQSQRLSELSVREKKRRQNRRRSRSLKEKILEQKHRQSEKKAARRAVRFDL
jgi:peptide chain release factor